MSGQSGEIVKFLCAVDVGDNSTIHRLIGNVPSEVLKSAHTRTLCNIKNDLETVDSESDYRSVLEVINTEMRSRGLASASSRTKRGR